MPHLCKTCIEIARASTQIPPPKVTHASYNIPGNTPKFCKKHADHKSMVITRHRTAICEVEGCSKTPFFNYFGETTGRRCASDKLDNMVNVIGKKCMNLCQQSEVHSVRN